MSVRRGSNLGNKSIERDAARLAVLQQVAATVGSPGDHGALTGLGDDDHAQYLLASGTRTLTGNMAVTPGVTIDGVDISAHAGADDAHHDPVTVDSSMSVAGQLVTMPTPGTLSASSANAAASPHTHAITASSAPGVAASLLKTDVDGGLTLHHAATTAALTVGTILSVGTSATVTNDVAVGTSLTVGTSLSVGASATVTNDITLGGSLLHTGDLPIAPTGGDVLITNADLQADDWVSGTTAWGILQDGSADFRSITADELIVDSLISDINLALAGTEIITKSLATVSRDFTVAASATLYVYDLPGAPDTAVFENGDWVRLRYYDRASGLTVEDCWGTVSSYSDLADGEQSWTWTKQSGTNGRVVRLGMIALDYGASGDGFIKSTVQDAAGAPYIDIATWITDPSVSANIATMVRLGNLAGVGFTGYGLAAGDGAVVMNDDGLILDEAGTIISMRQGDDVRGKLGLVGGDTVRIAAVDYASTNLVTDGSFESGVDGWTGYVSQDTSNAHTGSASLHITWIKGSLPGDDVYSESDFIPVSGDGIYFSLFSKPDSNGYDDGAIRMQWFTSDGGSEVGTPVGLGPNFRTVTGWAESSGIREKPVGATGFKFYIGDFSPITPGGAVGGMYLDTVRVFNANTVLTSSIDIEPEAIIITATAVEVDGDLSVTGDTAVTGTVSGSLVSATTASISANASVGGNLSVTGDTAVTGTVSGSLVSATTASISANANVGGGLVVGYTGVTPTDDQIRLYNGTTLMGQLSTADTTWLRINNDVAKDIYTPRSIAMSGKLSIGHTALPTTAGDISYAGTLKSRKSSVDYSGYITVPLTTPLTSTSWDGDAKTAASSGTIDLSAVFGAPAGIKGALVRLAMRSATLDVTVALGPSSTVLPLIARANVASKYYESYGMVPCDASGDLYFYCSGNADNVFVEIYGYLI